MAFHFFALSIQRHQQAVRKEKKKTYKMAGQDNQG